MNDHKALRGGAAHGIMQEKSGGENLWMNCAKLKNAGGGFETTAEGLATCIEDYNLSLLGQ